MEADGLLRMVGVGVSLVLSLFNLKCSPLLSLGFFHFSFKAKWAFIYCTRVSFLWSSLTIIPSKFMFHLFTSQVSSFLHILIELKHFWAIKTACLLVALSCQDSYPFHTFCFQSRVGDPGPSCHSITNHHLAKFQWFLWEQSVKVWIIQAWGWC